MKIYSFEPIVDKKCRVLILGTMPGVESLRKQQYYGYGRNAFWRIIHALFGSEPQEDYEMRKSFLLRHNIALWDVIKVCEREGSSDSDIKDAVPNDFDSFYSKYPNITDVCFNGGPAGRFYGRFFKSADEHYVNREFYSLPSTSPAYTIAFEEKLKRWRLILELLK